MGDAGIYLSMIVGVTVVALVLAKWKYGGHFGMPEVILLIVGIVAITIGTWKGIELSYHDVKVITHRDVPATPNQSEPLASDASRAPNTPRALDISGQYAGTMQYQQTGTQSVDRAFDEIVLDIQSYSDGTFDGYLSFPYSTPSRVAYLPPHVAIEGQLTGNRITFEARTAARGEVIYTSFDGTLTGSAIRGDFTISNARFEQVGELAVRK